MQYYNSSYVSIYAFQLEFYEFEIYQRWQHQIITTEAEWFCDEILSSIKPHMVYCHPVLYLGMQT